MALGEIDEDRKMQIGKRILTMVAAMSLAVLTVAPAVAAAPEFRIQWNDRFTEDAPGPEQDCGIDSVLAHIYERGHASIYADGRVEVREGLTVVYENQANGAWVKQSFSDALTLGAVTETLEGNLLTVSGQDTFRGNLMKWQAPGHGVIVHDAGRLTIGYEFVVDTTTGEIVSEESEILSQSGMFPWASNGFWFTPEQAETVCNALRG